MLVALLKPSMRVKSLDAISPLELQTRNIRGLVIDLDNTMTPWNAMEVGPKVSQWFKSLAEYNIKCCVVSNNNERRVAAVANALGIPFIHKATKPRRRAFYKGMEILGTTVKDTAVIGDQLFTDVLGGNRLGLFTILVLPISKREWIGTRVMRLFERMVFWSLDHLEHAGSSKLR
jgi:uncharacterized protein